MLFSSKFIFKNPSSLDIMFKCLLLLTILIHLGNLYYDITIKCFEKEPIVSLGMAQ